MRFLQSRAVAPYVFVAPFVISFLVFSLYPMISAIVMSFQSIIPGEVKWIGLTNYKNLWNENFFAAFWNSTRYTFWTLVILIPIPLIAAVLLNSPKMMLSNLFRSALFMPALTSIIVGGAIFRLIFGQLPTAPMNTIIGYFGFEPVQWTMKANTGMFLMVMLATWRWTGINILYFLAGLQNIPRELYEAADIDGASRIQKFFSITVPLLKPVTIYVLTISIFGGYAMFTESYVFWGTSSPNNIGLTMVGYLYQQSFKLFDMGFGAAIGVVFLAFVMILNLIQLRITGAFGKED